MTNRGGWCTNWSAYSAVDIWHMVEGEDDPRGWDQVMTWADIESVVNSHRNWLIAFKAEVDRIWPTGGSPASAAFARQLDMLMASMDETVVASGRTKHALNDIMTNLKETKARLQQVNADYDEASHDLMIRQIDGAEDDLNDKARRIMSESENVIRQHTPNIVKPPAFVSPLHGEGDDAPPTREHSPTGAGAEAFGSLIPPVRHEPPDPRPGIDPIMPDGHDWSPGATGDGGPRERPPNDGPVLSRVNVPGAAEPLPAASGPGSAVTGIGGAMVGGVLGGLAPLIGGASPPSGRGGGVRAPFGGGARTGGVPNGVIGGAPAGTRGGVRGQVAGVAPSNAGRRQNDSHDGGAHLEPENVWEVEEGVTPVIAPDQRRDRHDPGPGVIGVW